MRVLRRYMVEKVKVVASSFSQLYYVVVDSKCPYKCVPHHIRPHLQPVALYIFLTGLFD